MADHHLHNILINIRSKTNTRDCIYIQSKTKHCIDIGSNTITKDCLNTMSNTADRIDIGSNTITDCHLINIRSKRNTKDCVDIGSKSNIRKSNIRTHNALLSNKAKSIKNHLHNILIYIRSKTKDHHLVNAQINKNSNSEDHALHNIPINTKLKSKSIIESERHKQSPYAKLQNQHLHNIHTKSTLELKPISKRRIYHSFTSIPAHQPPAHCLRHCDESSKKQSLCFTRFFDFVFNQRTSVLATSRLFLPAYQRTIL